MTLLEMLHRRCSGKVVLLVGLVVVLTWFTVVKDGTILYPVTRQRSVVTDMWSHVQYNVEAEQNGYILTLAYTGQQTAGVRGLLSQQCWVASFNLSMHIVEPFISDSHLIHSVELWNSANRVGRFSDYFNLEHFNEESAKDHNPRLATWETFKTEAPGDVIVVVIQNIHSKDCLSYRKDSCSNSEHSVYTAGGCQLPPAVTEAVEYLENMGFKIVRSVCLNCQSAAELLRFPPEKLTQYIFGGFHPSEVTLLVNQWKFSIHMTPGCVETPVCKDTTTAFSERMALSPKLTRNAELYLKHLEFVTPAQYTVAMMIRTEWFLIAQKALKNTVSECLHTVLHLWGNVKQKRHGNIKSVLAVDVGKYGSGTFHQTFSKHDLANEYITTLTEEVKQFVNQVYEGKWTFEDWENSFTRASGNNIISDRGYVAALQGAAAAKADCLILMGGGNFQRLTLEHYIESHPDPSSRCIHHVCVAKIWERVFNDLIAKNITILEQ